MTSTLPESSFINIPHKIEGTPKEARASFYELAKSRIKYLTHEEFIKLDRDTGGFPGKECLTPAFNIINAESFQEGDNLEKWVDHLEVAVNKDAFKINKKDYSDLMPFVAEHEIYEAWLKVKKGTGFSLDIRKKHILAQRRAFLLAEQQGLGDKFLEWAKLIAPDHAEHIKQCEYALKSAKKQLQGKK